MAFFCLSPPRVSTQHNFTTFVISSIALAISPLFLPMSFSLLFFSFSESNSKEEKKKKKNPKVKILKRIYFRQLKTPARNNSKYVFFL